MSLPPCLYALWMLEDRLRVGLGFCKEATIYLLSTVFINGVKNISYENRYYFILHVSRISQTHEGLFKDICC